MLDPSNVQLTAMALVVGLIAAALIEAIWWIQGRILGERRQLWRSIVSARRPKIRVAYMGFLDTVKNLVSKNADKVDTAIDKVGDVVDSKTQGKYAQHVDKVQDAAKKAVDGTEEKAADAAAGPAVARAPSSHRRPRPRRRSWRSCRSRSTFRCRPSRRGRQRRTCRGTRSGSASTGCGAASCPRRWRRAPSWSPSWRSRACPTAIKWTIVNYKPPESMTLDGDGKGGVKVKLIGKIRPSEKRPGGFDGPVRRPPRRPRAFRAHRDGRRGRAQGRHPAVARQVQVRLRVTVSPASRRKIPSSCPDEGILRLLARGVGAFA